MKYVKYTSESVFFFKVAFISFLIQGVKLQRENNYRTGSETGVRFKPQKFQYYNRSLVIFDLPEVKMAETYDDNMSVLGPKTIFSTA